MTDSRLLVVAVVLGVLVAAVAFGALHGEHYRSRREELLEARISALEKIVTGRHK